MFYILTVPIHIPTEMAPFTSKLLGCLHVIGKDNGIFFPIDTCIYFIPFQDNFFQFEQSQSDVSGVNPNQPQTRDLACPI